MKKVELNKYFDKQFKIALGNGYKKKGYVLLKELGGIYFSLGFGIVNNDNSFPSTFSYCIGCKKINIIFTTILRGNEPFGCICTGQLRLFDEGKYPVLEYDIKTEADAQKMVDEVSDYIINTVLPEWEANPTIEYLEKKVNEKLGDSPNFSGLILSKLVGSSNYNKIKAHYQQVSKDWSEWDKQDFEKVITFLDSHSQEELLKIAEG